MLFTSWFAFSMGSISLLQPHHAICLCLGLAPLSFWGKRHAQHRHVKHPQSCRAVPKVGSCSLLWSAVLILMRRIGEAANPGPNTDATERSLSHFCIGAFNPSGLPNKAMVVQDNLSFADIWLVSETHLSDAAMHRFRQNTVMLQILCRWTPGSPPTPIQTCWTMEWSGRPGQAPHESYSSRMVQLHP